MAEANPLSRLPEDFAELGRAIPEAGRRVMRASVDRWFPNGGQGEMAHLRRVRFSWRFFIERRSGATLFGFIPLGKKTWSPVDAQVSTAMEAVTQAAPMNAAPVTALTMPVEAAALVREIAAALTAAYERLRRSLAAEARNAWEPVSFEVSGQLRLKADGTLATKPSQEAMRISIEGRVIGVSAPVLEMTATREGP